MDISYAVIQVHNNNFTIVSEWDNDRNGAINSFHATCQALWNDPETTYAIVKLMDSNLSLVEEYKDTIDKRNIVPS